MEVILKQLQLKNFKGIKRLTVDFGNVTNIYGDNGTGKSTVFDSAMWLLFDKDSQERVVGEKESNFQLKTYDESGNIFHGLDHEVIGILLVDGREIKLGKLYKEKWTKKKGEAVRKLTGHDITYAIDDIPVRKSEYDDKINSFIDEKVFKLLTNPLYFSTIMKWQDRRNLLLSIIGDIEAERVINYNSNLRELESLLIDKDIESLKKSISASISKLNSEIKSIPFRIDECNNNIKDFDFTALEKEKAAVKEQLKDLDIKLIDVSAKNDSLLNDKDKLYKLKSELQQLEYDIRTEANKPIQELNRKINNINNEMYMVRSSIKNDEFIINVNTSKAQDLEDRIKKLREDFLNAKNEILEIDENSFICPTCKRPLEPEDIENKRTKMIENFNLVKSNKLKKINADGMGAKEQLQEVYKSLESYKEKVQVGNASLEELEIQLDITSKKIDSIKENAEIDFTEYPEYANFQSEINDLQEKINSNDDTRSFLNTVQTSKSLLNAKLDEISSKLNAKENNEELRARVKELEAQESDLGEKIAKLEGQELKCDEFIKTKVELLEGSINKKFKFVKFKLFETQVNGALNETCEAKINGVPYSNANTAAQFNAGIDIINTLTEHFNVLCPIFIDNRESINDIIETKCQVVNLIVSSDKKLKTYAFSAIEQAEYFMKMINQDFSKTLTSDDIEKIYKETLEKYQYERVYLKAL